MSENTRLNDRILKKIYHLTLSLRHATIYDTAENIINCPEDLLEVFETQIDAIEDLINPPK